MSESHCANLQRPASIDRPAERREGSGVQISGTVWYLSGSDEISHEVSDAEQERASLTIRRGTTIGDGSARIDIYVTDAADAEALAVAARELADALHAGRRRRHDECPECDGAGCMKCQGEYLVAPR